MGVWKYFMPLEQIALIVQPMSAQLIIVCILVAEA